MAEPVSRAVVEGFYKALSIQNFGALEAYLHEDVVWTISGPVDILPFCGQRRGKSVVLKLLARDVPLLLEKRRMVPDRMLIDGDHVAVLGKLTAIRRDVGYGISYRIGQFLRFADEKLIDYVSIIDSFDAAEQMLGRPLLRPADRLPENGNIVSL